jgi:hypothetical protein
MIHLKWETRTIVPSTPVIKKKQTKNCYIFVKYKQKYI